MPAPYDVGDAPLLFGHFTDDDGTPTDPPDVSVKVRDPAGDVTTYTPPAVTNPEVGTWQVSVLLDQPGRWRYRFWSSGTPLAEEHELYVEESGFDAEVALTGYAAWKPTVSDVAGMIPSRTDEPSGTFTSDTRPTAVQADRIIRQVQAEVAAVCGEMPDVLVEPTDEAMGPGSSPAGHVVALGAASYIELQFYPEQQLGISSPAAQLWERYQKAKDELVAAVQTINSGEEVGDDSMLLPMWAFPAAVETGIATSDWEAW